MYSFYDTTHIKPKSPRGLAPSPRVQAPATLSLPANSVESGSAAEVRNSHAYQSLRLGFFADQAVGFELAVEGGGADLELLGGVGLVAGVQGQTGENVFLLDVLQGAHQIQAWQGARRHGTDFVGQILQLHPDPG